MTAYRFVTLTCDGCGEIWDEGIQTSVRSTRATALVNGWRHRVIDGRQRDFCRACVRRGDDA